MLVIAEARKDKEVLSVSQTLRRSRIIAKPKDFVRIGDVNIVPVEGNAERQVQVIGKDYTRFLSAPGRRSASA